MNQADVYEPARDTVMLGEICIRLLKALAYLRHYRRFQSFTMIRRGSFLHNLLLVDKFRHIPGAVVEYGVWKGG